MGVTGPGGPGSGYVVGGRLVLTSAHVVARTAVRVEVFQPGAVHTWGGVVVWCGTPGGRDDAALVLLDDDPHRQALAGAVRWGRLVTDRPGTGCETWGLPDVAQQSGAGREAVQLQGRMNAGSGFVGNRHVIDLLQHPLGGGRTVRRRGAACQARQCSADACSPVWWPLTVRTPGMAS